MKCNTFLRSVSLSSQHYQKIHERLNIILCGHAYMIIVKFYHDTFSYISNTFVWKGQLSVDTWHGEYAHSYVATSSLINTSRQ